MEKPVLLTCKIVNAQKGLFPMRGQRFANGLEVPTDVLVTSRIVLEMKEGEVYGTDSITKHPKFSFYNAGSNFYLLSDEDGVNVHPDEAKNKIHEGYILYYEKFDPDADNTVGESQNPLNAKKKGKTTLEKLYADKSLEAPTLENDMFYVDRDAWYYLLRQQLKRKNTLLVGESGAGKTELIRLMAKKLGKSIEIFDMAISNPTKVLCGNLRAENGSTYYQYSRFAEAIQQENMIVLDEISRAHPTANNILLPVTDSRRTLYIEDAIDDVEINVHKDVSIWATANIGAKFTGTQMLDHALLNRFQQVLVEYPPHDMEIALLVRRANVTQTDAHKIMDIIKEVRSNVMLSKDISTRQALDVAELVADGYPIYKAFELSILIQFLDDKSGQSERDIVRTIIQG